MTTIGVMSRTSPGSGAEAVKAVGSRSASCPSSGRDGITTGRLSVYARAPAELNAAVQTTTARSLDCLFVTITSCGLRAAKDVAGRTQELKALDGPCKRAPSSAGRRKVARETQRRARLLAVPSGS